MTNELKSKVLVVDDEPSICWSFQRLLGDEGHGVLVASSVEAGLQLARENEISLVLLDVRLPGEDGLTALPKFLEATKHAPIVVMTAFGDLETAVRAIQQGACDYLVKPFSLALATKTCRQAIRVLNDSHPTATANQVAASTSPLIIGNSAPMQQLFRHIAMVADSPLSVLITGETGTGKELVAAAIQRHSGRATKPYLAVAPVALSESLFESELFGHVRGAFTGATEDRKGLFELADGGTILLDEIGDLPISAQVKLLRVIEQQQFTRVGDVRPRDCNVRILAATHRDIDAAVQAGRFREDLLYRLGAVRIHLPPLRERSGDIAILCRHFLQQIGHPLADDAIDGALSEELDKRPWYGNVRELRHAVEHAAVFARHRRFVASDFPVPVATAPNASSPDSLHPDQRLQLAVEAWTTAKLDLQDQTQPALYEAFLAIVEPMMLRIILDRFSGNRAAVAELLGLHRATVRERLKKYGIGDTDRQ